MLPEAGPRARPTWHPRWTLALGLLLVLGLAGAWSFTIDDAFITFRYARHLATGLGLVWNPGERVEGYTDFLWMLLMAGAETLHIPSPVAAKVLGAAALAGLVALLAAFGRRHGRGAPAWWPAAGLLILPSSYYHAVSGLETVPYACAVFGLFVGALGARRRPSVRLAAGLPFLGLAAALLRPEGVLPAVLAVAMAWQDGRSRPFRRALALSAAVAGAVGAAYFAWRWSYFGWPLPNTAYVKVSRHGEGLLATAVWARAYLPFFAVVAMGWGARPRSSVLRRGLLLLGAIVLPYTAFRPVMDLSQRFHYPAVPVLVAMAQAAVGNALRPWRVRVGPRLLPVAAVLAATLLTASYLPDTYGYQLRNAHVALGRALARAQVPAAWRSLAVGDAGAISYYSDWRVLDWGGAERRRARARGACHHADPADGAARRVRPVPRRAAPGIRHGPGSPGVAGALRPGSGRRVRPAVLAAGTRAPGRAARGARRRGGGDCPGCGAVGRAERAAGGGCHVAVPSLATLTETPT